MSLENGKEYSRKAYEDVDEEIGNTARSVDANTPIEKMRETFTAIDTLSDEKGRLHGEAFDQATVENTARDEAKASQEKQAAEQAEAAELLKKMHGAAGINSETAAENVSPSNFEKLSAGISEMTDKEQLTSGRSRVIEGTKYSPEEKEALLKSIDSRLEELGGKNTAEVGTESAAQNVESKQEKLAAKEAALSPEQMEQQQRFDDAENLYKSLNLSRGFKEGKYQGASNENISEKIRLGLADEEWNDNDTRRKTLITTGSAAVIGAAATMGAGFLAPSLLVVGGIASVGIAAIGGLGWAGMKAYHALKERKHRKTFEKLQHA